jgi:ABC-type multidrug transport system ATPase subunit
MDPNTPPPPPKSFLRLEHLWVRKGGIRGRKWIVKDVSFEVRQGEFVAIIGPNGAGKTKLLESIVGDRPYAGQITLYNQDLYANPEHWLQHLGWVPSYNVLHDSLRAEQALIQIARLRLPGRAEESIRKRIGRLLDQLEFPASRRQALIRDLSSGERKRLDLCAELITNPPLLILDEPTTNLDPDAERYLMELLRNRAWGKRQAVVVVTHTLQSLYLCDRVIFMAKGRVRAEGRPEQVLGMLEAELGKENNGSDEATRWASIYRKCRIYENEPLGDMPASKPDSKRVNGSRRRAIRTRPKNWINDLKVLLRRNWLLFINNLPALGLYLLLGPFSGLLSRIVLRDKAFVPDSASGSYSAVFDTTDARQAVFILALVVTLLGMIGSFLDVTRERLIYRYERIKGLSPWAYLLSKWIILSVLVGLVAPSTLLAALTFQGQTLPGPGYALLTLYLACIAAVTLGLAISAVAHNESTATGLLGIVVVFYLFFSGGVDFNERFRGLLDRLSVFAASHWAAEGLSSGIQLYCWAANPRFQDYYSLGHLISVWLYLAVYILFALGLAFIALRMQDAWFPPRQRLAKSLLNGHIWSLIPLILIAFSWAYFFKARSLDYFNLRSDLDNVRIADYRGRDAFQSVNGYLSESNCAVPTPLPPPATPIVAFPPTPRIPATQAPQATPLAEEPSETTALAPFIPTEEAFQPLPAGVTTRNTQIYFGPEHGDLPLETLPGGAPLELLGKDLTGEWLRVKEESTGRELVGWLRAADTDLLPSQTGAVARPPACAIPRAYLEDDGGSPAADWVSDVEGHVVAVVDLFRDEAGQEVSQGNLAVLVAAEIFDQYPLNITRHSFLFRGLAIDVPIQTGERLRLVLVDAPLLETPLHLRASIFYVPGGCGF